MFNDSTLCRLCGEENDNGIFLYCSYENEQNLCDLINTYLPIKLSDDGKLPRTICPGCNIQLEATMVFIKLIIKGQKLLRELYENEISKSANDENEEVKESLKFEFDHGGVYPADHSIVLKVDGVTKPKRKRGRPPKKPKTPSELAQEVKAKAEAEANMKALNERQLNVELSGKRQRKTPTRFKEAVQGKELERIFMQEGVIDDEDSGPDLKDEAVIPPPSDTKVMEIIGHSETSGELVVVVKGKGRGRPKGRMRITNQDCAICGKVFLCMGRYMSHIAQHGPVMYQCEICRKTFTTRLNFNQHQEEEQHKGQIIIQCMDKSKGKSNKIKHEPTVTTATSLPEEEPSKDEATEMEPSPEAEVSIEESKETVQQESDVINTQFLNLNESQNVEEIKSAEPIIEDTKKSKGEKKLKCTYCDKTFNNQQNKTMHIKATHLGERPYVCKECGAAFPYPRSLSIHALTHRRTNSSKGFACDLCGKVLSHPSSVVYHKEAEHAGQSYVCSKCGKCFKHKQLLQRHQLVHSQLRPYNCKICNSSFKTKANLVNHHTLHSGLKRYSCELCKQKFGHKTSLTLHLRWHTGQKPFTCTVCNKSFTQKGNLSEHMRIHTGEKPYQCGECPRRFTTSSQYRLHLRRHTGERPYSCTTCGKKFISRESWSGHMRREAGARHHRCECGRAFGERWALLKHRRSHTGERPFSCPYCTRAFADCSNLNKHKKQVHKQMSLLASANSNTRSSVPVTVTVAPPALTPAANTELDERVIFVTYDMHSGDEPAFHIIDPEQTQSLDKSKVLTSCDLYEEEPILVGDGQLTLEPDDSEKMDDDEDDKDATRLYYEDTEVVVDQQHITVTDEHGNPLHFTMQDGTQLAITSMDGKTLQVITQDGETIPIEINEINNEMVIQSADTIVHHLNVQKEVDDEVTEAQYLTIV